MPSGMPPRGSQPPRSGPPSQPGYAPRGPMSQPGADSGAESDTGRAFSFAGFFADALDGALGLVHADGGSLAVVDDTQQAIILRARRTRPRVGPTLGMGAYGAQGRQSQPLPPQTGWPTTQLPANSASNMGRMSGPYFADANDEAGELDDVEEQSTQLLPATLRKRTYRPGERLIGHCWQLGQPVLMRGDEVRTLPGGGAPKDTNAPWHLAVPILRPGQLSTPRATADVIGVIAVYNRDPLWSFTPRDGELLALHADRVARAMYAADLARQNQSQASLLNVLGNDLSDVGERGAFARLRDILRRMFDAPSFAILLYDAQRDEVSIELAERNNEPIAPERLAAATLPPWWRAVRQGQTIYVSAPEDRLQHPEYCTFGLGSDMPVQSLLAAPLAGREGLIGALLVASPRSDVYAPEQAHLFTALAHSSSAIVQHTLLEQETQLALVRTREKEERLAKLNNALLTLSASLDLDMTARALAVQASLLTRAEVCAVFLLDEPERELVGQSANIHIAGTHTPLHEVRVPVTWHDLRKVLRSGQLQPLANLDAEWNDGTEIGRVLAEYRIRSCLVFPLAQDNKAYGALIVYTPGQSYHFTAQEMGLLQGLASQGSVAISNATLYQQLQIQLEKQKELDRLKDEFILTISHEFRTPVTAIQGYVSLISKHSEKLDQVKLAQFAGEIQQATTQLTSMINMMNDANTIDESHPLQITTCPVNVRATAQRALVLTSGAQGRVMMDIPADLWVEADSERLDHVFTNLLSNAIKYSPAQSGCEITARLETREHLARKGRPHARSETAPARWVVVGVRDHGEGISAEDQGKLFQKFVRLSRSLTTSVRGTGLGLWICRQYVEGMGGDIWVESEPGQGAHFQFSLPYTDPPVGA